MFALPKAGFARKTGTAILGVTLLSSLMLTACAPASKTNDTAPNPTASSSAEASKGVTKFKTTAFDVDKQTSVDVEKKDDNIFLGNGVVSGNMSTDAEQNVSFTPYEDKDKSWKYDVQEKLDSAKFSLMRWKNKTYVVVQGWVKKSTPASGLQAAKNTSSQSVIVLDAETGKEVKIYNGVETDSSASINDDVFYLDTPAKGPTGTSGSDFVNYIHITVPTGLVYRNGAGHEKLVDPLTGSELAVYDEGRSPKTLLNNETGFYEYAYSEVLNSDGVPKAKATFGNFALVATSQPESRSSSGSYVKSSKYELVNTLNKTTVGSVICRDATIALDSNTVSYSPNFRYVSFGNVVFDTQSKAAFCGTPLDESVRRLFISDVDNEGNIYAAADRQYLKVNIADTTKVETLVEDFSAAKGELPELITDKGSALFYSENSEDTLVVIPAK